MEHGFHPVGFTRHQIEMLECACRDERNVPPRSHPFRGRVASLAVAPIRRVVRELILEDPEREGAKVGIAPRWFYTCGETPSQLRRQCLEVGRSRLGRLRVRPLA